MDSTDHVDSIEQHVLGHNTSTVQTSFQEQDTRVNKWDDKTVKTCQQSAVEGELTYVNVNNDLQVDNTIYDTSTVSIVNKNNTHLFDHDYDIGKSKLNQDTGNLGQ